MRPQLRLPHLEVGAADSREQSEPHEQGNTATEVVKYFLQLHFNLKTDLRQRWVLERDNFYNLNS